MQQDVVVGQDGQDGQMEQVEQAEQQRRTILPRCRQTPGMAGTPGTPGTPDTPSSTIVSYVDSDAGSDAATSVHEVSLDLASILHEDFGNAASEKADAVAAARQASKRGAMTENLTVSEARGDGAGGWVVDVARASDAKVMATLQVTEALCPPRKSARGKVVWSLPSDRTVQPRLGLKESQAVLAAYKKQRKVKKDANREVSRELTKEQKKREKKERWAAGALQRFGLAVGDGDKVAGIGFAADFVICEVLEPRQHSLLRSLDNGCKNGVALGIAENRQRA